MTNVLKLSRETCLTVLSVDILLWGRLMPQVRTVSAANKKCPWYLAYAQLFFDILGTINRKKQKIPARKNLIFIPIK